MIPSLLGAWTRLRRQLSRHELAVRLLGLPRSGECAPAPGLILVQIDGFSQKQFERALEKGRMPFLKRLIDREEYRLRGFYPGLPATTPAVQGEIFYGVKTIVPSFSYRDHDSGRLTDLMHPATAQSVQKRLEERGRGVLAGGSAYSDVYSGGAQTSSFCASRVGFANMFRKAGLWPTALVLAMHLAVFARMAGLTLLELGLAFVDLIRGVSHGRRLSKELLFIPKRVGLVVLLREFVTAGVMIDAARGVPVIHCNFFGYDEQSHRRGPDSAFAHWTLKGIDNAIRRIWNAAGRSAQRDYDLWVYSDHGQDLAVPYEIEHGQTLQERVDHLFERHGLRPRHAHTDGTHGGGRETVLGPLLGKLFGWPAQDGEPAHVQLAAMGPVGHIYPMRELTVDERRTLAEELVHELHVPSVLFHDEAGALRAKRIDGEFVLPEEIERVIGPGRANAVEISSDLVDLAKHPDAGELILLGWRWDRPMVTFAFENGSHAGPGTEEAGAFLLLPPDAPLSHAGAVARPLDLRHAILRFLHEPLAVPEVRAPVTPPPTRRLRLMTYNVHSCRGLDGRVSTRRIARIIARYAPDVVALQELDAHRNRTGGIDQADEIASLLSMDYHFHPSFVIEEEQYGNALLSTLPIRVVQADGLPGLEGTEPRGALWVECSVGDQTVQVIATHLGLRPQERLAQAQALLGEQWLGCCGGRPAILCGDLNAGPGGGAYRALCSRLRDACASDGPLRSANTWMGLARIDHVLVTPDLRPAHVLVPRTRLTWLASDHWPLIVDLHLPQELTGDRNAPHRAGDGAYAQHQERVY